MWPTPFSVISRYSSWTLPAKRMKGGRTHRWSLSAVRLVDSHGCFPGSRGTNASGDDVVESEQQQDLGRASVPQQQLRRAVLSNSRRTWRVPGLALGGWSGGSVAV